MLKGSHKSYSDSKSTLHAKPESYNPHFKYDSDIELVPHSPNPEPSQYTPNHYPSTPQTSDSHNKMYEGHPQSLDPTPRKPKRPSLLTILFMPTFLILAGGIGAGHHFFYAWLDTKSTDHFDPSWAIRIGTAASFLFKTFVYVVIATAYVQRMWLSLRNRYFSLSGLDALFTAVESPKDAVFEPEMWKGAKLALFIAVMTWTLPLAAVFTPATLTLAPAMNTTTIPCNIPSGDITNPSFTSNLATIDDSGFYARPSPMLNRAVVQALTGRNITWSSPCGTNCTYQQDFFALYLNCTEDNANAEGGTLTLGTNELYKAVSSDLVTSDTNQNVSPLQVEWSSSSTAGVEDRRLLCLPRQTKYNMQVTYSNSKQNITILDHTRGGEVFGRPPSGSVGVGAKEYERVVMTAMLDAAYYFLEGSLDTSATGSSSRTDLMSLSTFIQTAGQGQRSYKFLDVKAGLEKFMLDISLSLIALASESFSPPLMTSSTCDQSGPTLIFAYHPFALIVSYGAAVGIGLLCMIIGLVAQLGPNRGIVGERTFSAIMGATRNESIDALFSDRGMTVEQVKAIKLRYARLRNDREAFGVKTDFIR